MVVDRAEDASWLDGHHPHTKLAPRHALDLEAKVDRCKTSDVTPFVSGAACASLIVLSSLDCLGASIEPPT